MKVLGVDPGTTESAFALYNGERPVEFGKVSNEDLLELLTRANACGGRLASADHLAIEMVQSFGMPVGAEVFETVLWAGRFVQAFGSSWSRVYRKDVKLHLCGQPRAKDANIRQALIDKFGPGKDVAIGKKASPGPLFGVSSDVWSALAVAVTFADGAVRKEAA